MTVQYSGYRTWSYSHADLAASDHMMYVDEQFLGNRHPFQLYGLLRPSIGIKKVLYFRSFKNLHLRF
jgi:hypothetical protein